MSTMFPGPRIIAPAAADELDALELRAVAGPHVIEQVSSERRFGVVAEQLAYARARVEGGA